MAEDVLIVFVTCPDAQTAEAIAAALVNERAAACVNILSGVQSVYRWHGKIETDRECLLLIKTHQSRFEAVRAAVLAHHPDELPEVVAVPVAQGLPAYLDWVRTETTPSPEG